ncbi:SH2 domain-containing protein 2A isoform X3 [Artibeus jamaicensis]|uniref:SH2 domain-containing protein 2A isoform X3 n=1 Tax=Artibeus jamaicensis TaxID=9417 RepID=UPI00235AC345|nr:SH2 domain-containing protein 2A isoform X3 [Artibeus jamaicensis]
MKEPGGPRSNNRSHETPTPTFSTFQPMDLAYKSCQGLGLLPVPRLQALKAEEAQFIPTAPNVHTGASSQALGAAPGREDTGRAEEVPREGGHSLQAETRAWFQETQAQGLLQHGAAPPWFHGFITRREAERLLETEPEGCYLVRFSESAVTFVLTYRSRTCCRHFLLAQLGDGRHVVLGEDSAHTRLQDLLRYYTGSPLSPYGETLSQPLARQPPRPKPPVPAKPQLPAEVYTSSTPRPRPAVPPKPSNPIYHEPDEPIAFYAMGRGSPGEAPCNIYAEVEVAVPSGSEGPPCVLQHPVLWKCRSRPVPGSQNPGGRQLRSENSAAEQGSLVPHQPLPLWGHSLPHTPSGQVLQHRGQAWLSLGPPQ